MIAIFTVLGLVLFGGGAYAIYDGWPYLVLERGFTQVIIGSIASSAGLILLSLAWVLREIVALKRSLAEGVQMRAESQAPPAAAEAVRAPWEAAPEERFAKQSAIVPAAVGAAAGAVAVGAVADALVAPAREAASSAPESAPTPDRDLFGALVAKRLEETEPQQDEQRDATSREPAEPLPDMFEEMPFGKPEEPKDAPIAIETESHEPAEIVAAKIQSVGEDEALAHAVEPAAAASQPSQEHADRLPAEQDESKPVERDVDLDEFSALRESLAGHLNEPLRTGARVEPRLASEADPFAEAEAWMDKASPRKEPWFESPAPAVETATEAVSPPWPPRTEAPEFAAPAEPAAEEPHAEPEAEAAPDDAMPEEDEQKALATPVEAVEDKVEDDQAPSPERAASDEGVVGAYQVGDAHFTIYADGSIRARTPDGEYSFASMDELKVYLASEKSRLGM
ncbi:hypothetical protein FQV39_11845 [Bosea sp. F3-2]|uniref:hypothetical protein n=1 Tax=Bosea sp. F3-2 TaxID=2599640 RepID=UPI0011F03E78|nr:hypothetical protein [Bosea sp. F3-2]QEL23189.1 hypothetical protein FQV39_11845 [Bosea sp. F3-2]